MLAQASMGAPAKGSWGSYQAWWAEGNKGISARALVSQDGAPTAAKAAVGHLAKPTSGWALPRPLSLRGARAGGLVVKWR
jgi:hypothetical protein